MSVSDDCDDRDDRGVDRCSDSIEISVLIELVNMRKTLRWHLNILFDRLYDLSFVLSPFEMNAFIWSNSSKELIKSFLNEFIDSKFQVWFYCS